MYEELGEKNFEIVAVAQDTGGEQAAGPFYDAAEATYTTLIDTAHAVSSLYNMINVPTGVWIDEEGIIVRPNEVAYSENVEFGTIKVNGSDYREALTDWVENGRQSRFYLSPDEVVRGLRPRNSEEALADASFKLAVHFYEQDKMVQARRYWQKAQNLQPESWNYHRQDWSFLPREDASENWKEKFDALGGKPYYEPLELESR